MKKILSILSMISIVATSASSVISCGAKKETNSIKKEWSIKDDKILESIKDKNIDLGEINDFEPSSDNNEFNWNVESTNKNVYENFNDFGSADDKIGYYEVACKYFSKIDKGTLSWLDISKTEEITNDVYGSWLGFSFELKNGKEKGEYTLLISSNKETVSATFKSNQNIQLTLNSIYKDEVLKPISGSEKDILEQADKLYGTDIKLAINNRMFSRTKDQVGYTHTIDIDDQGKGTIELFDSSNKYGGLITQRIEIQNYDALTFDYKGNPYYYYDDRFKYQKEAIKDIDSSYKDTMLNSKKHVIILGLDGLREDRLQESLDSLGNFDYKNKIKAFDSQAWESVYGWKSLLTGSISGDSDNIFEMVKNSKSKLSNYANVMWGSFSSRVFTTTNKESGMQNIADSFSDDGWQDLSDDNKQDLWLKEAKDFINDKNIQGRKIFSKLQIPEGFVMPSEPGNIEDSVSGDDLKGDDASKIAVNTLKSISSFNIFNKRIQKELPNLSFQYDTLEDNEGHAGSGLLNDEFYESKFVKSTLDTYAEEISYLFNEYGNDENNLIIVTTDHGRDDCNPSHQGYDFGSKKSWFLTNKDLTKYTKNSGENFNQYSLKEIVFNFLKEK